MWPDRVSNPEPLPHDSDTLPTAIRGSAIFNSIRMFLFIQNNKCDVVSDQRQKYNQSAVCR